MNSISEEQNHIIERLKNGSNVIVDACAGSGKSTTILSASQEMPDKYFLQLTYNSMLRREIKEKIETLKLNNINVHTFHSLAVNYYYPNAHTDTGIRHILHNKMQPVKNIPLYGIIVIDEAQDMTPLYFQWIVKFTKDMGCPFQLLILGDYMQGLYEFKGADTRFLTLADKIWKTHTFEKCKLQTSYRITQPIAKYVNTSMLKEDRLFAIKDGPPVTYIRRSRHDSERIVINTIKRLLETGSRPSDIFILGASVKGQNSYIRKMENALVECNIPCHVPMFETEPMNEKVIDGKVVFSTFHCVKGRQRKHVFVIGFDQSYFSSYGKNLPKTVCPNTLYVACTRSSETLHLLESDNYSTDKPLDFLQLSHHDMINVDYVEFKGNPRSIFYDLPEEDANKAPAKRHFTTPTDLIKFIPEDVLEKISPMVEEIFSIDGEQLEPIEIPTIIQTKNGMHEDVSDINGIAIPNIYYDVLARKYQEGTEKEQTSSLYTIIENNLKETKTNEHLYLKKISKELPRQCTTTEDYLFLSNLYIAIQEKLYFKLHQICKTEYNWITDDIIELCNERMRRIIENSEPMQEPVLLEKTFIHQSQEDEHYKIDAFLSSHQEDLQIPALVRFTARIDLETDTTIWEIKCTSSLTMEHYLQVVIYAWLWKMTQSEIAQKKQFKLFNIKTGQVLRLSATDEQLDFIVLSILKGKYQVPVPMTDEIFLAKMEDCHRTYS